MATVFDAIASATAPLNTGSNAATETWNHTCTGSNLILFVWITMNGNDVSGSSAANRWFLRFAADEID